MRTKYFKKRGKTIVVGFYFLLATAYYLLPVFSVRAQNTLTLTITPPFFQINLSPGEFFSSSLKVVNTNPADLPITATVSNFEATDEAGHGRFVPIPVTGDTVDSLASWIKFPSGTDFVIPKGESQEISFTLQVPKDASPGGHYAAILVGTKAPNTPQGSALSVASYISSLFFVRVAGDVQESGDIREFSADRTFYASPSVHLSLRFENKGNVHLHPEGDIAIYDMWGKERGRIPVNNDSAFGNVLPKSIRKFDFSWQGEKGLASIGRYTAVATLAYGDTNRQNVSETISFWVIPVWETAGVLGGSALLVFIIILIVRWYVRRSLFAITGQLPGNVNPQKSVKAPYYSREAPRQSVGGVLDLRNRGAEAPTAAPRKSKFPIGRVVFLRKFKWFLAILIPIFALAALWFTLYSWQLFREGRTLEIQGQVGGVGGN